MHKIAIDAKPKFNDKFIIQKWNLCMSSLIWRLEFSYVFFMLSIFEPKKWVCRNVIFAVLKFVRPKFDPSKCILRFVPNPFKSVISLKILFRCHTNTRYEKTVVSAVNETNSDPKYSSYLLASIARNRSTVTTCAEIRSKIATFFQFKANFCGGCNGRISSKKNCFWITSKEFIIDFEFLKMWNISNRIKIFEVIPTVNFLLLARK